MRVRSYGRPAQLVAEIGDQIVEPAGSPTRRTSASWETGFSEAKTAASTCSIHSRHGRRAGGRKAQRRGARLPLRWRRRATAVIGRTAGTPAARKFAGGAQQDEAIE